MTYTVHYTPHNNAVRTHALSVKYSLYVHKDHLILACPVRVRI